MSDAPGYLSGTVLGRYTVGPLLGRGGMGEVYRADDAELHRAVALKVLPQALVADPDRLARFVHEARAASALNHPHLVSIYEIGESAGMRFIAMELVAGETLRERISRGHLELPRVLEYLFQAAEAIAAAHAAGIVHRDLKPENLMVAAAGYVKVLDFGLAKLRAEPALMTNVAQSPTVSAGTSPGLVVGTVGYMSPEQAQGRPVDHRSDIFSFGCILYEAATGARAFSGDSAVDTLHQIIHADPAPVIRHLPGAPHELQRIVQKCLQKDPDDRYQSMKEAAVDLRGLRRQLESGSGTTVVAASPPPAGALKRVLVPVAAVAAILAVIAAALFLAGRRDTPAAAPPTVTVERLTGSGNVIDAVVSPDGKYLAYVESLGGHQALWLRQTTGTQPLRLIAPEGGFWGLAFAPDGSSIVYGLKNVAQPTGTIYSIPILGGQPRALLNGIDSAVTFSPDGAQLAFLRAESDNSGNSSIVVASADGTNARALVTMKPPDFLAPAFYIGPSWSPDGRRIAAAMRNRVDRTASLITVDVADKSIHPLGDKYAFASFTAWLPDGSGVVFTANAFGTPGTGNGGQLWLQPFSSGQARRLTSDVVEYRNASITADGSSIVSVGFSVGGKLYTQPYAGGDPKPVSSERFDGTNGLAYAPDGSRFYYVKFTGRRYDLWSAAPDGSDGREILADVRPAGTAVSADGKTLVVVAERNKRIGIWRVDAADGGNAREVAAVLDPQHVSPAPDGKTFYFTSAMDGVPSTYRVGLDGAAPVLVARYLERAVLSPDGTRLAGVYREGASGAILLGILSAADGTPIKSFPNFFPGTNAGSIMWAPDGGAILYTTTERSNIWRQRLAGGAPEKVTNFQDLVIVRFAVSRDTHTLIYCRGTLTRDAFLLTNFR